MPLPAPVMALAWVVVKKPVLVGVAVAFSYAAAFAAGRSTR